MKKINEKIKNLFKREENLDLIKIFGTLLIYFIVFSIFYAGYEFRNVSSVKNKVAKEEVEEYRYYITFQGRKQQYTYNESKSLFSLIEDIENMELDFVEYYEGKTLKALGGNPNFKIEVNGEILNSNFFDNKAPDLKSGTKIIITN
jgi:hypothetical protein